MLTVFTLGYEGRTIEDFLNQLTTTRIEIFLDVRNNPHSRKRGFSKKSLQQAVENLGIDYVHLPELGIPSALRKEWQDDTIKLLNYYATHIIPQQTEAICQLKTLLLNRSKAVLVCFEKDYHLCHRHKIIEFLKTDKSIKFKVIHLESWHSD